MGLFNKKKEEVPKLEPYKENELSSPIPSLPSLPKSNNDQLNQNLIKSSLEEKSLVEDDSRFKPKEENLIPPKIPEVYSNPTVQQTQISPNNKLGDFNFINKDNDVLVEGPDSIFVKIDKFKEAKKEINEMKKEIEEISSLLTKINEENIKEEQEMKEINLNFDSIRKRFNRIETLVFDKF